MSSLSSTHIERDILLMCKKLGKSQVEAQKAVQLARMDPEEAQRIYDYYFAQAEARGVELVRLNDFEKPESRFMQGKGIYLGDALAGDEVIGRFSIPGNELTESSILMTGQTGMGKSYETCNLILRIREHDPQRTIPIYDSENEYAGMLANFLGPDDLTVISYRDYWKNMFQPMEIFGPEWIDRLASDVYLNFWVGDSGKLMFSEGALKINTRKGVISRGGYSPYGEFVSHIAGLQVSGKQHQYKFTLLSRLKGLANSLGPIYNHRRGFSWDHFAGRVLVINLWGLDALARAFFTSVELSNVYYHSTANPDFRATVVFDEFSRYAHAGRRSDENAMSSVSEIAKTGRKRGLRLLCSEQNVSLIHPEVLGNIGVFFAFKTRDPRDRYITSRLLNLDEEQSDALATLQPQKCAFICGCLDEPVQLRTPDLNVRDLSAEALEWSRPFVQAHHKRFKEMPLYPGKAPQEPEEETFESSVTDEPPDRKREDSHLKCTRAVGMNPFRKQKEYYELWGLRGGVAQKMKEELVSLGFVEEFPVNPGGSGHRFNCLRITERGIAFANMEGAVETPRGKGSPEHICLQHMVARKLMSMGADASVEGDINAKNVDVKAYADGKVQAWEIELEVTEQTYKNIRDDLGHGADFVRVLIRSQKDEKRATEMVQALEDELSRKLLGSSVALGYVYEFI